MRVRYAVVWMMLLVVALGVVGCATVGGEASSPEMTESPPSEAAESPPATEPSLADDPSVTVVLSMIERVNAVDFDGAAELIADDAMIYFIGMPPTGMEIYQGADQFRTMLEECCTEAHFVWEVTVESVEDGVVYAEAQTWMDLTRDLGVAPNTFKEVFVVTDGKVSLYASTMTEETLARFKPALAKVMSFEVPLPPARDPGSEIAVTITGGTCAYNGPLTLQAGDLTVTATVEDQDKSKYAVTFFALDPDRDFIDLMASTLNPGPPSWSSAISMEELGPGETLTYEFPVEEGPIYMICWSQPPDIPIGQAGPFSVQE